MEQNVVLRTFRSDCEQRRPLNEHSVVDVRTRRTLLRTLNLTLWGTWYRARTINPRHTAPLDSSHESSECLKQITLKMTFLFSFAVNVNEQRIIGTEKCCYLNLRSTVRTQLR